MESITPIFLLSLPRSGSTLLQRLLAVDPEVATTTEPWLLLPLIYARRKGSFTEFSQWRSVIAHEDFIKALPNQEVDYREELAGFAKRLYRKAAGEGPRFFLDKTPRYSLIANDLLDCFPDAVFIYLWRNPLAVAASMMETWAGGKWNVDDYRVDFYCGLPNMLSAAEAHPSRVHTIQYERLLADPRSELSSVFTAIGRPFDAASLEAFSQVRLTGRFGDQIGVKAYATLNSEPLDKWKATMSNTLRQGWGRRYLRWLGRERLARMGYDLDTLLGELRDLPRTSRHLASDAWRMACGSLNARIEWELVRSKGSGRAHGLPPIAHS